MSPGNEIINKKELGEIKEIFTKSDGVLFAHGFDKRRKNIFKITYNNGNTLPAVKNNL